MKPYSLLYLLLAPMLMTIACDASAQTSAADDVVTAITTTSAALPSWDQLTPQQRELLVAPLRDRWNQDADNRQRMLEHAQRWGNMTPEQRQQARRGMRKFEKMTPEQRQQARALYQEMRKLDKVQRNQLREQWKKMSPAKREQWMKDHPPSQDMDPPHRRDHDHGSHRDP